MTQPETIVYSTDITPCGSKGFVGVEATAGTQAIGAVTGDPLDGTTPGTISLTVRDDTTGVVARIRLDGTNAILVRNAVNSAELATTTRDLRHDMPRKPDF